ncbi:RIIa domain-containing protein 1 [Periophthalmus magnuspinnatus]|uniref:RIIa domain-containing protein 1 n=1 Tax=Periophthalmus magnuspinnatus TaxID=409849 RepID=UPI00145A7048|nr:RIIa domain-containing protein 1 [Periophthalmus magnuspinnatus]
MTGRSNVVKLDRSVLSAEQQEKLNQFKIKTRIDNENYLRSHPEIELLVGDFIRNVLLQRPVDVRDFAAEHFTNPNLQSDTIAKMDKNCELE